MKNYLVAGNSRCTANMVPDHGEIDHIGIYCWENATFTRNGHVSINAIMKVFSNELVELYKRALGIPDIDPIRKEKFLRGFSQEQEMMYGFHIANFKELKISQPKPDVLYIHISADAIPTYTYTKESNHTVRVRIIGADPDHLTEFLNHQTAMAEALIQSIDNHRFFVKRSFVSFFAERSVSIIKIGVEEGNYLVNGHMLKIRRTIKDNSLGLMVDLTVDKNKKKMGKNEKINNLFSVEIELNSERFEEKDAFSDYNPDGEKTSYDIPWRWVKDFDIISLEGEEDGVYYSIDMDFYLALDGTLHYATSGWSHYEAWVDTNIIVGLETYVYVSGEFEKSWSIPLYSSKSLSEESYDWCGSLAIEVTVVVSAEAELKISAEGQLYASLKPEARFNLVAGGYLDITWSNPPLHYKPKFSYSMGGSFEKTFDLECGANIVPGMKVRFTVLLYNVVGPELTAHLYLDGKIGFSTETGTWWRADICLDLLAGVNFLACIHWEWPVPLYHIIIKTWEGGNPPEDKTPPITNLSVGPMNRGYVGKQVYLWFNSTDRGNMVSGVKLIKYRIPEAEDNGWKELDYPPDSCIEEIAPGEDFSIEYYSIDNAGNKEEKKTIHLKADLNKPELNINFEGPYVDCGDGVYQIGNKTKVKFLGRDVGLRRTDFRIWTFIENNDNLTIHCTEWFDCRNELWKGIELEFPIPGNYKVKWIAEDKVGNCRYREVSLMVDKPSIAIISPKMGDITIFDRITVNFPLYPYRLFVGCRYVQCKVKVVSEGTIEKVEFECDGKRVIEEYPNELGIYEAKIKGVSSGKHRLIARGYNQNGEVIAEDSIMIHVIAPIR